MHRTLADRAVNNRAGRANKKKTRKDGLSGVTASLNGPRTNLKLILIISAQAETCLHRTPWERRGVTESGSVKV